MLSRFMQERFLDAALFQYALFQPTSTGLADLRATCTRRLVFLSLNSTLICSWRERRGRRRW
jgi:hypothetical protein